MAGHAPLGLIDAFAATLPTLDFQPGEPVNDAETVLPMRDGLPKLKDFPPSSVAQGRWPLAMQAVRPRITRCEGLEYLNDTVDLDVAVEGISLDFFTRASRRIDGKRSSRHMPSAPPYWLGC